MLQKLNLIASFFFFELCECKTIADLFHHRIHFSRHIIISQYKNDHIVGGLIIKKIDLKMNDGDLKINTVADLTGLRFTQTSRAREKERL